MHTAPMRDEHDAFCLVSGNCLADVDQAAQLAAGADAGCARAAQQPESLGGPSEGVNTPPRVVTWNVASLDGRIAISRSIPAWRDERWAPVKRAGFETVDVMALHETNVQLGGSNNFVARDAGPADLPQPASTRRLYEDFLPDSVMRSAEKWMAIVDSRGRVAWNQTEGGGYHLLVLACRSTPPAYLAFLRDQEVPYLVAGDHAVDLSLAVLRLAEALDTTTVLSDAGGLLNGALLRAGLVDEIDVQILPLLVGVPDAPSIFESYGLGSTDRPLRLRLLHQEARPDGSLFLRFVPEKELA